MDELLLLELDEPLLLEFDELLLLLFDEVLLLLLDELLLLEFDELLLFELDELFELELPAVWNEPGTGIARSTVSVWTAPVAAAEPAGRAAWATLARAVIAPAATSVVAVM